MLTLAALESRVAPHLGGAHASGFTPTEMVNTAGRHFFSMHQWQWRRRPAASLDLTGSQAYISLPTDFGELISLVATSSNRNITLVSWDELLNWRQVSALTADAGYYAAISNPAQTAQTAVQGVPRLELHPTPTASVTGAFSLIYKADWIDLTAPNHYPNLPQRIEHVWLDVLDAYAEGTRNGDRHDRLDRVYASSSFRAAIYRDQRQQMSYGPITNGVGQPQGVPNPWNSVVSDP